MRTIVICAACVLAGCSATLGTAADTSTARPAVEGSTTFEFSLPAEFSVPAAPTYPSFTEPAQLFASVDLELVRRVAVARKCEARTFLEVPCETVWSAVAGHGTPETNPYATFAAERVIAWKSFADQTKAREHALSVLESSYRADVVAASKNTTADGAALAAALRKHYEPFESELSRFDLADLPRSNPKGTPAPLSNVPWDDPLGTPDVLKQRVVITAEAGAYAESFDLDTADDGFANLGATLPSFDLSGFFAGTHVLVNVASEADLAIGIGAHARVHVGTGLPATSFESGASEQTQIAPADENTTTSFVVGIGPRVAGNVAERIAMSVGLELGYLQVFAPGTIPLCGESEFTWDPALRGFQGDIALGFEFYPLSVLSLGLTGRVGFAHVESEWCTAIGSPDDTTGPVDVSADSLGAGASGNARIHF